MNNGSNENMFGVTRVRPTKKQVKILDKIAKEEGAYEFIWILNAGQPLGWFVGPNRGFPFDRDMSERVLSKVKSNPDVSELYKNYK